MKFLASLAFGLALALLCGCGVQGAPQPPSLDLPQPVNDLSASRKGDKVTLTWTQPAQTTDKIALRHLGRTNLCRATSANLAIAPITSCSAISSVPPQAPASSKNPVPITASLIDALTPDLEQSNPTGAAEYAVQVMNARGRSAGLSNQVTVPLAPVLPPPSDLQASVAGDGIHLSANPAQKPPDVANLNFSYRVYRIAVPPLPNETPTLVAELPASEAIAPVDISFAWEKTYAYHITPATTVLSSAGAPVAPPASAVEGDDSAPVTVFAHDIFPPAVPTGLQAVYSGMEAQKFIDLSWNINTESDFAGYNVYRHESGAAPVKITAELVKSPAFRDAGVAAGHTYFYSVTAVDLRGNESALSQETSESVPQ